MAGGFANAVIGGGGQMVRNNMHSQGFVSGSAGWQIAKDGSAEFSNVIMRGSLQAGGDGTTGHPGTTYNAAIPASLSAYYTVGSSNTITAPETVVNVNIGSDGAGSMFYEAMVIDSSTPKVTSKVAGFISAANVVTEWSRTWMDAQPVTGQPSKFVNFMENTKLVVNTGTDVDPTRVVLATSTSGDTVDGWSVSARGTQLWGPGGATAPDTTFYRVGVAALASDPIDANVTGAAETWHAVAYVVANTWVDSGGTDTPGKYRKVAAPSRDIETRGSAKNGNHANGTTVFILPAGYRPTVKILVPIACQGTAAAGADSPRMEVNTNGNVNIVGCATGSIFWNFTFSTDA